jgi:hypothetical protein
MISSLVAVSQRRSAVPASAPGRNATFPALRILVEQSVNNRGQSVVTPAPLDVSHLQATIRP